MLAQTARQTPPADAGRLALPDQDLEDDPEMGLHQLTLAQFTVATLEHVIPLLKTGKTDGNSLSTSC